MINGNKSSDTSAYESEVTWACRCHISCFHPIASLLLAGAWSPALAVRVDPEMRIHDRNGHRLQVLY
jgi:hypothetical protein